VRIYNKAKIEAVKLIVDPDYRLYFKNVLPDGRLKDHVFLVGDGQRDDLFMWQNQDCLDFPANCRINDPVENGAMSSLKYLSVLSANNLNYARSDLMRLDTWDNALAYPDQYPIPQCGYNRYTSNQGTGLASDGCYQFRLRMPSDNDMNDNYFSNRTHCFTDWARHLGVFVEYTLFDASILSGNEEGWNRSIWKTSQSESVPYGWINKNGERAELDLDTGIKQTEIYDDVQAFRAADHYYCDGQSDQRKKLCYLWLTQLGLIERMATALQDLDNFFYEVCNEALNYPSQPGTAWTGQMVEFIQGSYPRKLKAVDKKYHHVNNLEGDYTAWCAECSTPTPDDIPCDIVDAHLNPGTNSIDGLNGMRDLLVALYDYSGTNPPDYVAKPRINNENYIPTDPVTTNWPSKVAWTTFVGGGHYQRHVGHWRSGVIPQIELDDFAALKKFVHNTNFWKLRPDDNFFIKYSDPNSLPYPNFSWSVNGMSTQAHDEFVVYIAIEDDYYVDVEGLIRIDLDISEDFCYYGEWYFPEQPHGETAPDWIPGFKPVNNGNPIHHQDHLNIPPFKADLALHLKKIDCP
jgi:hypothetical protein